MTIRIHRTKQIGKLEDFRFPRPELVVGLDNHSSHLYFPPIEVIVRMPNGDLEIARRGEFEIMEM